MKKAKHTVKEITIVGVVEEYEEEDTGLIIATDEDDYVVELNKQGKRLSQEVGMDVEVTGVVTKDDDGTKRITIKKFEVLESDDDDDDDDETYFDDDDDDETYFDDDDDDETYYDDDDDDTRRWL